MESPDAHTIEELLDRSKSREKLRHHDEKIMNLHEIGGCRLTRERSDIIDEGFLEVVGAMKIPPEVLIVGTGAT